MCVVCVSVCVTIKRTKKKKKSLDRNSFDRSHSPSYRLLSASPPSLSLSLSLSPSLPDREPDEGPEDSKERRPSIPSRLYRRISAKKRTLINLHEKEERTREWPTKMLVSTKNTTREEIGHARGPGQRTVRAEREERRKNRIEKPSKQSKSTE